MRLDELRNQVREAARAVDRRRTERDLRTQRHAAALEKAERAEAQAERLSHVQALFDVVGKAALEVARHKTESMVSEALGSVFGDRLSFEIEMGERGGRPEATFRVKAEEGSLSFSAEPMDAHGGGVTDVLSLALRMVLLEGAQPAIGGPLVLDEPGKHVSSSYAPHVAEFVRAVGREFDRQVILVTHNDPLAAIGDVAYSVRLEDGTSVVASA